MPSSTTNYEIELGQTVNPTSQVLSVVHGMSSVDVWNWDCSAGDLTLYGPVKTSSTLKIENRNQGTGGIVNDIVTFVDASGTVVAAVSEHGQWRCVADQGFRFEVVTGGLPTPTTAGRTIAYHQTTPSNSYWLAVAVSATVWKKVPLPN